MAEAREWTAEIQSNGFALYAWVAFNPEWETFATSNIDHARTFKDEVVAWIERLKIEGARPVRAISRSA